MLTEVRFCQANNCGARLAADNTDVLCSPHRRADNDHYWETDPHPRPRRHPGVSKAGRTAKQVEQDYQTVLALVHAHTRGPFRTTDLLPHTTLSGRVISRHLRLAGDRGAMVACGRVHDQTQSSHMVTVWDLPERLEAAS